jgi:hypothetical protein
MKYKSLLSLSSVFLIFMMGLLGCTPSAYICPLKDLPGACRSQMDAYQATLRNKADKDSIFSCDPCIKQ